MTKIVVMEEQKINALLKKVELIYDVLVKNQFNSSNEINGYISEDDACKLIGKSKTWLWRRRTEEVLPFKKLGSKIYYEKSDLFNLLKKAS